MTVGVLATWRGTFCRDDCFPDCQLVASESEGLKLPFCFSDTFCQTLFFLLILSARLSVRDKDRRERFLLGAIHCPIATGRDVAVLASPQS